MSMRFSSSFGASGAGGGGASLSHPLHNRRVRYRLISKNNMEVSVFEIGGGSEGGDKLLARQSMTFGAEGFKFNKYGKALNLGDSSCKFIKGEGS